MKDFNIKKNFFVISLFMILIFNIAITLSTNIRAAEEPRYTGFFTVGPCSGNCIGNGDYCWQCQRSLTQKECTPSNPYCASY